MTYRLYFSPGSCALGPHVLLEELRVSYEAVKVSVHQGEQKKPGYLAINPRGRVPTLAYEEKGKVQHLTESVAILTFLAQRHPESGLLPENLPDQARALEWLCWLTSVMHQTGFRMILRPQIFTTDPDTAPGIKARALELISAGYADINDRLSPGEWALGEHFSIVDIALLVHYRWGNSAGLSMREAYPRFAALMNRVRARPAVAKAIADEGIHID